MRATNVLLMTGLHGFEIMFSSSDYLQWFWHSYAIVSVLCNVCVQSCTLYLFGLSSYFHDLSHIRLMLFVCVRFCLWLSRLSIVSSFSVFRLVSLVSLNKRIYIWKTNTEVYNTVIYSNTLCILHSLSCLCMAGFGTVKLLLHIQCSSQIKCLVCKHCCRPLLII